MAGTIGSGSFLLLMCFTVPGSMESTKPAKALLPTRGKPYATTLTSVVGGSSIRRRTASSREIAPPRENPTVVTIASGYDWVKEPTAWSTSDADLGDAQ